VDKNVLQNVITFPPTGLFVVDSEIGIESEQRCSEQRGSFCVRLTYGKENRSFAVVDKHFYKSTCASGLCTG
jgi:hypothetical protein